MNDARPTCGWNDARPPLDRGRPGHLCERCGGTGAQAAGLWDGRAYASAAGACDHCGGTGRLDATTAQPPGVAMRTLREAALALLLVLGGAAALGVAFVLLWLDPKGGVVEWLRRQPTPR